ncbi:MAG: IPT/TIG domain-containing protein [Bacteroidales bacterium]|jgi:hypothetical protein|nr:IPT/TIG domain-containing protein [Bacteroidales bacterium]
MDKKQPLILFSMMILTVFACRKAQVPDPVKPKSDTLYVTMTGITDISAQGAIFNAKVYDSGQHTITEYGFVWSDSTVFPTKDDFFRSFIGHPDSVCSTMVTNDLEKLRKYYVRAFLKTDTSLIYSDTMTFKSLGCSPPVISRFYPDSACGGRVITIIGKDFSPKRHRNKVFLGTVQVKVIEACSDTLQVFTPNTTETKFVNISVEVAQQVTTSQELFRWICPWSDLASFPGETRFRNTYFTIGSKGYVCLGKAGLNSYASTQLWEYDFSTDTWQEKQHFPVEQRYNAIGFSVNGKGYVGLGEDDNFYMFKDLWQYDPELDTWTRGRIFPGTLKHSLAPPSWVVLNNKLYLYLPGDNSFWEYDPQADLWTKMPENDRLTGKWVWEAVIWNNRGFFVEYEIGRSCSFILWEYKPAVNEISEFDSVATASYWINQGSFIIHDKFYLPLRGYSLMEYDFITKSVWYHNSPVDQNYINSIFIDNNRAILGISENKDFTQFYPR